MILKLFLLLAAAGLLAFAALRKLAGREAALKTLGAVLRPGAGLFSLALVAAALVFAVRGAWIETALALGGGMVLGVSARARGPARQKPAPSSFSMDRAEAARLLGVPVDASPQVVKEAHKRLMRKLHPDAGGTDGLAAQLNRARDLLLGKMDPA